MGLSFRNHFYEVMVQEDICCFSWNTQHMKDKYPNPPLDSQDIRCCSMSQGLALGSLLGSLGSPKKARKSRARVLVLDQVA